MQPREILNISTRSDLSLRSSSDSVLSAFNLCSYDINFRPFNFFVNLRCTASIILIYVTFVTVSKTDCSYINFAFVFTVRL